ncbi:MAG: T9SS type A sorting domain-containing protein [Flavobacteriales bacterium]|nr:T9SS type A sorting domain-containing protein [Flavobacteriales bacterium]
MRTSILIGILLLVSPWLLAQEWSTVPGYTQENGLIRAMEANEDSIVFLGVQLLEGEEHTYAAYSWNSQELHPIGPDSEFRGFRCMEEFNDEIYFGGNVKDYAGIDSADVIVRFDGQSWSSVGQGICLTTSILHDMQFYNNSLIVCGMMDEVDCNDSLAWYGLGQWTGDSWNPIGGVWGYQPEALVEFDGLLYVVGDFTTFSLDNTYVNVINVNNIASWDGENWGQPQFGVNGTIYCAIVHEDKMYVGGYFSNCSGTSCANVASWDGESWEAVGDDLQGDVYALAFYQDQLYAAGYNVLDEYWIAYFDGYNWQNVPGCNLNNAVHSLGVFNDHLYVGGNFTQNGSMAAPGLIRYYLHPDSVQWGEPSIVVDVPPQENKMSLYPNPAKTVLKVRLDRPVKGLIRLLSSTGQELLQKEITPSSEFQLDISHLSPGVYFVYIHEEEYLLFESFVID